jgi:hypothetical protein
MLLAMGVRNVAIRVLINHVDACGHRKFHQCSSDCNRDMIRQLLSYDVPTSLPAGFSSVRDA